MIFYYYEPLRSRYGDALAIDANYNDEEYISCPECGNRISGSKWLPPFNIEMEGNMLIQGKYPDFIHCYGGSEFNILMSEKALTLYNQSGMTGIEHANKIDSVRFANNEPCPDAIPDYYDIFVARSRMRVCREKTRISYGGARHRCRLYNPAGKTINYMAELTFDEDLYEGYDIFSVYELGSEVFFSQRFVNFCRKNKLRNFSASPTSRYGEFLKKIFSEEEWNSLWAKHTD